MLDRCRRPAGVREVNLSLDFVEELNTWRAERKPASVDDFVFATDRGRPRDKDSVREAGPDDFSPSGVPSGWTLTGDFSKPNGDAVEDDFESELEALVAV